MDENKKYHNPDDDGINNESDRHDRNTKRQINIAQQQQIKAAILIAKPIFSRLVARL